MKLFKKILIANRGEIAVRINKSAQLLGIKTVSIFAEIERDALHTEVTNEAFSLGHGELKETYLNIDKIISIAKKSNCDAIHPGYGFLAENPKFVFACNKANITFIGPSTESMKIMGNKIAARKFITEINVPTTQGLTGPIETIKKESHKIPFPLLIKAAAGGGGKGMRIVKSKSELNDAIEATSREAENYFNDGTVYIEQYIENPRHIEVQILADNHGNVIHLFERECSIQRRYQKIIEESPSPTLTENVRKQLGDTAVKIAKEIGYTNAGTIEFLVDSELSYYFLEMNTRIQVEHPVTEMVTGVDIVKEQILIAAGNLLSFNQADIVQQGHAIECRIYAEEPENGFLPSPGTMTLFSQPAGNNIRIDSGVITPTTVESSFDPMISKLIVWDEKREGAIQKSMEALNHFVIHGINTNISFLKSLLRNENYKNNTISTHFCDDQIKTLLESNRNLKNAIPIEIPIAGSLIKEFASNKKHNSIWNTIGYWRDLMVINLEVDKQNHIIKLHKKDAELIEFELNGISYVLAQWKIAPEILEFELNNQRYILYHSNNERKVNYLTYHGFNFRINRLDTLIPHEDYTSMDPSKSEESNEVFSPMPGKVIKINIKEGDHINKGDNLIIIESMKMENQIKSHKDAVISKVNVKTNDKVTSTNPLIVFEN